jgi:hypothetical protein
LQQGITSKNVVIEKNTTNLSEKDFINKKITENNENYYQPH